MYSAGNDIIALDLINKARSNDNRFYSKILTASEKAICQQPAIAGLDFEYFLWLCWSVKESAYKYLKRKQPALTFSPTKIIIQDITVPADYLLQELCSGTWEGQASVEKCCAGRVIASGVTFYFRSKLYQGLIATVVSETENFAHTFWGIQTIGDTTAVNQSKAVRTFLLNSLQRVLPATALRIEKTSIGYPIVFDGTNELMVPVSIAHHGKFIAYSYSLPA